MEETKNNMEEKETKVFTKEEVENIVQQVNLQARTQCENLFRENQALREQLMYRKLDYLFKVVENSGMFPMEFVEKCVKEIEETFTAPETEDAPEKEGE